VKNKILKYVMIFAVIAMVGWLIIRIVIPQPIPVPAAVPAPSVVSDDGCPRPDSVVLTKVGVDLSLASASYAKLALGKIDVKTDPGVIDLVGKVSRDAEMRDYLRCLALRRDRFTPEQAAYLERFNGFMAANPTAAEFTTWQAANPFPKTLVEKTVPVCPLNVSAEWDGLSAPEKSDKCTYTAPAGCTILSADIVKKSDNNGQSSTKIAEDSRSLTAYASATPHGSVADRKRGWIELVVNTRIRCAE